MRLAVGTGMDEAACMGYIGCMRGKCLRWELVLGEISSIAVSVKKKNFNANLALSVKIRS